MNKPNNRILGLCGAALTMARGNPHELSVMSEVRGELERVMVSIGFLNNAPFEWITLSLRFGLVNETEPHYQAVNKKYGDLPIAIELDTHELQHASPEELKRRFTIATLRALVHVGKKYALPHAQFAEMLSSLTASIT